MLRGYLHYLLDADNVKYVLANGTGPYSDQFSRNFRHFLWIDDVIYMIDDLKLMMWDILNGFGIREERRKNVELI